MTGRFDEENAAWECEWDTPKQTSKAQRRKMLLHYENWRNSIFLQWSKRTGKKVLIINVR